jgi:hypothetical protein
MSTQNNFPLQDQATSGIQQNQKKRPYIINKIYKARNIFRIQNILFTIKRLNSSCKRSYPDAGHWIYNKKSNKWVENMELVEQTKLNYSLRREIGNSKYTFHIDSFPRQGNTSLRGIFLEVFPNCVMPDPMVHVASFTELKIKEGHIAISTLRDPHDSLSSFISRSVFDNKIDKALFKSKNKINKERIKGAIKFYNRYCAFNIENYDKMYFVKFEEVLSMYQDYLANNEKNNYILKYFSKKYNLPFATIEKTHSRVENINYRSTVNQDVKAYLITNKFYLKKIKKSYKLFNQLTNMIDTNQRGTYDNGI